MPPARKISRITRAESDLRLKRLREPPSHASKLLFDCCTKSDINPGGLGILQRLCLLSAHIIDFLREGESLLPSFFLKERAETHEAHHTHPGTGGRVSARR